jgi:hypothetical protein
VGLPAVLIHGTGDDIVSLEDSRRLAASSGARLVEIDDGHRLSSIRESGLLDSVLKSLGLVPLLEGADRPETPRSVRLDWLSEFLALDTSPERRAELAAAPLVTGREAIAPVTAALRGTWRQVDTPAAVAAKQAISQFLVEVGNGYSPADPPAAFPL